ncbi:MAG: DUF3344 domain-containing protein [Dehalococcoidia bacterium]
MKKLLAIVLAVVLVSAGLGVGVVSSDECTDCGGTTDHNTLYPPTVPLTESFRAIVTGDYVAAGVAMRDVGSGDIDLSLPTDATIVQAFLYWAIMSGSETPDPEFTDGNINGNDITGTLIGTAGDPCWPADYIHNYVADVTDYATDGTNELMGFTYSDTNVYLEGASLVVIYTEPGASAQTIIIYEGAVTFTSEKQDTTIDGFVAATGASKTTYIVADGQATVPALNNKVYVDGNVIAEEVLKGDDPPADIWYWDTYTAVTTAYISNGDTDVEVSIESDTDDGSWDCLTWVAQVLSVPTELELEIDIKPWSYPNTINPKSGGVVPVAILGSDTLDVTQIDPASIDVVFGPDSASPRHNINDPSVFDDHTEDPWLYYDPTPWDPDSGDEVYYTCNEDDVIDLALHFRQNDTGLTHSDTTATLSGSFAIGGVPYYFIASDSVRVLDK